MNPQKPLPKLIKQSAIYKLYVPEKVEEKIRYLIRKYPHTEWSGILFYKHSGTFEDNNLKIICEDIYPMDLGTSGWTEFKMNEDVAAYMADNIDLFECETGLIHSHHSLGAFFSGQDTHTLQAEGNDTNCFVSLIVDTKGTYVAAITRKLQLTKKVTIQTSGVSYEFFGEGKKVIANGVPSEETTSVEEVIQYFMLDVEREVVDNPLAYLDYRFNEIERKKEAAKPIPVSIKSETPIDQDEEFFTWLRSNKKKEEPKQATLFDDETMDGLIDTSKWQPDPTIIHQLAAIMITSSLFTTLDSSLEKWISKSMVQRYDEIFEDFDEFDRWADSMVEFIVNHYNDPDTPAEVYDDFDTYMAKIAEALVDELKTYPSNKYIEHYKELLSNRIFL